MKALVIPANSSEPVRELDFVHDESWRYVVTTYDDPDEIQGIVANVAFLTKKNAPRDYSLKNSRASEYVKDHLILRGRIDGPEGDLYGDVLVLGHDGFRTCSPISQATSNVRTLRTSSQTAAG